MGRFKSILILGSMVSLVVGGNILAEEISVPYSFSSGTTIRSSEVNVKTREIVYQFYE